MIRLGSLLLTVSALWLSGCVAAIIPLAAGGAVAAEGQPAEDARFSPAHSADTLLSNGILPEGTTAQLTSAASLPPPGPDEMHESLQGYRAFSDAVRTLAQPARRASVRSSALLAMPGGSITRQCGAKPPAVLIDLDPSGGLLDLASPARANPPLSRILAGLRSHDVAIFWISSRPAEVAGAVAASLRRAGLDPAGTDTLLLMRSSKDRKQTQREDIGQTHCLLAIAGDERKDFDEMYGYLRDPNIPTAADRLIGERWFLTPNPLY